MQHLLERYSEASLSGARITNTPEKRLVQAYYQAKHERESLLGQASRYITINYDNKKYTPVFDSRYETEIAALHFKALELAKKEEDLLKRIDQISGQFQMDIRGLHEEKASIERQIEKLVMFPTEQEEMRKKHLDIVGQIDEYKKILGNI